MITNALSQQTSWQYDFNLGKVTQATDANSVTTTYSFAGDQLDRLTGIVKGANLSVAANTNISYIGTEEVDVSSAQYSSNDNALHTATLYDGFGRETTNETYESSSVIATTKTCYSNAASLCSSAPGVTTGNWTLVTDQTGRQRQTWTDGLGRLTQVIEDPAPIIWWA